MAAEFERAEDMIKAAEAMRDRGYGTLDAYTPFPVEDLPAALGVRPTRMPAVFLVAALMGAMGIYLYQYYTSVWQYPWVIGGKPLHSWPSFVPLTFEVAVLSGAVMGFVVMLVRNRLPQPYHPMSNVPGFERASRDRFFLSVEVSDPLFERAETAELLRSLGALQVVEVPQDPEEGRR